MKQFFLFALVTASLGVQAQKKPVKPAPKSPVKTAGSGLRNQIDSVSYAAGLSLARFYADNGMKNLDPVVVARAIADVQKNNKKPLTEEQCNTVLMRFFNPDAFGKVEKGEKFLAENKNKPGVKTTATGLQYEVLRMGTGIRPTAADTVEVNYMGTLIDGSEFDNSYKRGQSISFPLSNVIKGWTEGLQLMPVGSKFKFYVPQQLGYGMNDMGNSIPGGSVLVFEVELLNVKKAR